MRSALCNSTPVWGRGGDDVRRRTWRWSAISRNELEFERRLFLNVVVAESTPVFQSLARKDDALLIGRDALSVLNLALDCLNRVARFSIERELSTVVRDGNEHIHGERR